MGICKLNKRKYRRYVEKKINDNKLIIIFEKCCRKLKINRRNIYKFILGPFGK